jgi:hypothetical protein
MSPAVSTRAKGREALFREIASARGGAQAVLLSDTVLGRAHANLDVVAPEAHEEVRRAVELLQSLSEVRGPVSRIWKTAHDLRGLAGAFGLDAVGVVAGAIRWYGMDAPADFTPNWALIEALASMLAHAFRYPDQTPVDTIAKACRDAVTKQLLREGRPAGDGGL